ncbi:hypothetical protein BASA81_012484 [Batrachochytrium salamandrivorans]|nr:hypothetical protein BASA81_012484 [Batrachochytrium salamandrivorans]
MEVGIVYSENRSFMLPPVELAIAHQRDASPAVVSELDKFLSWKDAKVAKHAERLLQMYSVQQVASAVRDRYGMTPPGWRTVYLQTSVHLSSSKLNNSMDLVINELLDTEKHFVKVLLATEREYLDKLFSIYGSGTSKQIKALGLTQQETNLVFEKLVHIRQFSEELIQRLYCVDLVREQAENKEDRALCVANAFLEMGAKLHVFAPATMCYKDSLEILSNAEKRLSTSRRDKVTFMSLWEQITKDGVLQGQQFGAVLIRPLQRVPRYKMLLEALAKGCQLPQVLDAVHSALELVCQGAIQINQVVGQHEKLGKLFGQGQVGEVMSSSASRTSLTRGNSNTLVMNAYNTKIASMI